MVGRHSSPSPCLPRDFLFKVEPVISRQDYPTELPVLNWKGKSDSGQEKEAWRSGGQ